jgi:hypothetical protein
MKVIVKFTDDVSGEWTEDILDLQKKQGYINIKYKNGFVVTEPKVSAYRISTDWIERIIEE